jgi:TP901 family phage tail tape measure protein
LDLSGVDSGIQTAKNSLTTGLQNMGAGIASFGSQVTSLGASLTILTAPLNLFMKTGIETAASFESAMAEISARTGLTGTALEQISDLAKQMGADTSFSAQQAAEAFLQLLSSGQSAEEAIATLPVILDAAAASGENLGQTADVVTDIMAAFHLGVDDARMVVDALARAAGASSADMASLGQGFANIGPIAAEFGISVDETASILAIFSENGIKGAEAGTQLRSMLKNMTADTDRVQGTWSRLGISMYDAQGKVRPMSQIMADLTKALAPMTEKDRIEVLSNLGGAYGQMGLSALTAGISIDEMQARMAGQADASDVAAARMDTFNGRVESLKGSIETLMIEALTPFMEDVLQPLVEQLITIVNGVTDWVNANPELASQIMQILAVVGVLGPVLVGVGLAISAIGTVIGIIASPIVLIIGLLVALYLAFSNNFLGIRDAVQPFIDWFVNEALPAVVDFINTRVIPGIQAFVGVLVGIWTLIQPGLQSLFDWFITTGLPAIVDFVNLTVFPAIEAVVNLLAGLWAAVEPGLTALFTWFITTGLPSIVTALTDFKTNAIDPVITLLSGIWESIKPSLESVYNWFMTNGLPFIRDALQAFIDVVVKPGIALFNTIITLAGEVIGAVANALGAGNPGGAGQAGDLAKQIGSGYQSRDGGGPGMADVPYLIGKGAQPELFMPSTSGTFIPNADQLGGVHIGSVYVTANSAAEGRAAAESFEVRLTELMRARGG